MQLDNFSRYRLLYKNNNEYSKVLSGLLSLEFFLFTLRQLQDIETKNMIVTTAY
jgi:hypothetical protein